MGSFLQNKKILITGGTGSIGNSILRQALKHHPKEVLIFSRDEMKQYDMQTEYENTKNVKFFIGDVYNQKSILHACKNMDIIFHAAAIKQVPITENFPTEAINTNVIGTQNVIDAAIDCGVRQLVNISTDKAVEPTSVLGTTKRLAEKLIISANKKNTLTIFCSVRFGNVLGSRGSVIPKLEKQIRLRQTVTVTDMQMTRFIMSIDAASKLVLDAAKIAKGGEIFVLKMKSAFIKDYVNATINHVSKDLNLSRKKISIKIIGKRAGEKIHERLLDDEEMNRIEEKPNFIIVKPHVIKQKRKIDAKWFSSKTSPRLSIKEMEKMVSEHFHNTE